MPELPEPLSGQFSLSSEARQLLHALNEFCRQQNLKVWLVGGAVRDLLLNCPPLDFDCALEKDALALGRQLADKLHAAYIILNQDHPAARLVWRGTILDLADLRAPGLEQDLAARDYTINALALSLDDFLNNRHEANLILDPLGGRADLYHKRLRLAGPDVLLQDYLRVLRGYRFMAELGLKADAHTRAQMQAAGPGLAAIPGERLGGEWLKLMAAPDAYGALKAMDADGALKILIPAWEEGRGVKQNKFHHLSVEEHNLACFGFVEAILRNPAEHYAFPAQELEIYQDSRRRAVLKTAALWHDLAKPRAMGLNEEGEPTFYRHDQMGRALAQQAGRALGLSKAFSREIGNLVGLHMRPFYLLGQHNKNHMISARAIRRLLEEAGPHLGGLFVLSLADTYAGQGPARPLDVEEKLMGLARRIFSARDEVWAKALQAPPLLNGRDLMAAFDISPGPEVGHLLTLVREAQLEGVLTEKQQALVWLRQHNRAFQL